MTDTFTIKLDPLRYKPEEFTSEENIATINAADNLIHQLTTMMIDGWFSEEYDLPDQRNVTEAAKNYIIARYPGHERESNDR